FTTLVYTLSLHDALPICTRRLLALSTSSYSTRAGRKSSISSDHRDTASHFSCARLEARYLARPMGGGPSPSRCRRSHHDDRPMVAVGGFRPRSTCPAESFHTAPER